MTFFEAAVAVLRDAGRPLHFKKIATQAADRELLSHTGREPEETMRARLSQEAKKPASDAVIEEVRPGVFGLRAGADLDDATETIAPRTPSEAGEPEPVEDDADPSVNSLVPVSAPKVVRGEDDDRRRRRRGREDKRGKSRGEPRRTASAAELDVELDAGESPALDDSDLNDIARAVADVLSKNTSGKGVAASTIASALSKRKVGRLGLLGTAGLRDILFEANATRAAAGRPPAFEETKPNFWMLAVASGGALAKSYAALERWQFRHRNALVTTIVNRLRAMKPVAVGTVITLLLDRLGYSELKVGEDGKTIGAKAPRGLTRTTVAIRTFESGNSVGREQIAELRGSLHQFSAAEGVVIALGEVTEDARVEATVANVAPVTILTASEVAEKMVSAGVGVARFSVDVSCLDETVFRELRKA